MNPPRSIDTSRVISARWLSNVAENARQCNLYTSATEEQRAEEQMAIADVYVPPYYYLFLFLALPPLVSLSLFVSFFFFDKETRFGWFAK